jgi:L-seryl-tRNA(Ser) seleniumtransferase
MDSSLRSVPAVGTLLNSAEIKSLSQAYGAELVTHCVRRAVDDIRASVEAGTAAAPHAQIVSMIEKNVHGLARASLKPVINATGIILHTNLGRAPLGDSVVRELSRIAHGYTNLEFDCAAAKRGKRNVHAAELLAFLTGAEASVVVNNNAGGIILVLHTLAKRKEVIISRGELIEIGGAFRIPEIMKASGAKMIEVGTTNRTRLSDYEKALSDKTAVIFKAHKSNYSITGFAEEVAVKQLAAFAHKKNLPFVYDIGSGLLRKPSRLKDVAEPDVRSALSDGADLVAFSCDKLLGGPQAGVVAGKKALVDKLARAPLMRALRAGKLTYAALGAACRSYLDEKRLVADNPVFAMLTQPPETVEKKAGELSALLSDAGVANTIEKSPAQCGGGSLPDVSIESRAVKLTLDKKPAEKLYRQLMLLDMPVIAVLKEGALFFDVFAVGEDEIRALAEQILSCFKTV